MGGKSSTSPGGYKYYAGFQMVLARHIHRLLRIRVDQKIAWSGNQSVEGIISINAPDLFGAKGSADPEGGIVGDVNFQPGLPTQMPDSYLQNKIGHAIPASRGVSALVGHQVYMGNNPYMKDWDVRAENIHQLDDGSTQWYDEKSAIPHSIIPDDVLGPTSTNWAYKQVASGDMTDYSGAGVDVSSWPIGTSPFGGYFGGSPDHPYLPYQGFPALPNTNWDTLTKMWIRTTFNLSDPVGFLLDILVDDYATVWVNGHLVLPRTGTSGSGGSITDFIHAISVTADKTVAGVNTFTALLEDTVVSNPRWSYGAFRVTPQASDLADMNPVHMLRECLTNVEWGYGYDPSDIDDVMFKAVADALYSEGLGLSYFWDDANTQIGDVIESILAHIDGQLYVDRRTQLWSLVLIRSDYDVATLPEFTDSVEIISMDEFARPGFMDLYNEVTVSYYDFTLSQSSTITLPNSALFLQQGVKRNKQNDYNMCCNSSLASRLCLRDLRTESTPLASGTVYLIPTAETSELHRGSVCKLTFAKYSLYSTVVRVTGISFGDGTSKRIKMSFTEDVFAMPGTIVTLPSEGGWVDPGAVPVPIADRMVTEVPYAYLLKIKSQTDLDAALAASPDLGYIGVSASRPGNALNAKLYVDSGAGYESNAVVDFCAFGKITADIGFLDATLTLSNTTDIDEAVVGTYFQIGNEILTFSGISAGVLTGVKRGLFDTVAAKHTAGDKAFFIENYLDGDGVEYSEGESVNIKVVTVTSQGTLALGDAGVDTLVLASRAILPYPPGNVKIGGVAYPAAVSGAFAVTWAHRNRVTQATQLVDTSMGDVTPEVNTRYGLRFLDSTGALLVEQTNIGPNTASAVLNYTGDVTMQLYSITDNGRSIQQHEFVFAYTPPGGTVVTAITATAYTPVSTTPIIDGGSA